jgi:RNA polymerase sigma-70 factor (ECF subfamily)
MLNNVQDAEDVTQTVFLNAFLHLRSYDPRYRFFSWVYRMAVNESLNMLRRRKRTVTLEDEPDIRAPGAAPDRTAEAEDRVGKALMSLKPDDRAVVVLRHFVSFSYQEIADVLEIPVQTVKSRLYTARERLKLTLGEQVR